MRKRIEYSYDSKSGIYNGERENYITDRDPDFITLPFCTVTKPENVEGQIAIITDDKVTWKYVKDKSGNWYNIETKEHVVLKESDYDYDVSSLTKEIPPSFDEYIIWNGKKWIESKEHKDVHEKQIKSNKIKSELNELDAKSIRALMNLLIYTLDQIDTSDLEKNDILKEDLKILLSNSSQVKQRQKELRETTKSIPED